MKPKCKLIGKDGNIFNLMGLASKALKAAGKPEHVQVMVQRITTSAKSYDEALNIIMEYVDVE